MWQNSVPQAPVKEMHSWPHPNQVRSACERCRQLKLRCLRQTDSQPSEPCTRCIRLNLHCQQGTQRKVGRPTRRDLVRKRQDDKSLPALASEAAGESVLCDNADLQFPGSLDSTCTENMDWPARVTLPFEFTTFDGTSIPSDYLSLMQSPSPPDHSTAALMPSDTCPSSDIHFETLSKINVQLHALCNAIFRHAVGMGFETFASYAAGDFQGMDAFRVIMQSAQEYLATIKALHRVIGTRSCPAGTSSKYSLPVSPDPDHLHQQPTRTLNSPIAYLVVSCFVQLIRPLEVCVSIMHARIADTSSEPRPAQNMAFAGVTLLDFSTQALLAIELVQHVLSQIQLVLGLPSPRSSKSGWSGLLTPTKYREMLNAELGLVEDGWTVRPAKLNEMMSTTKELLLERTMAGG